MPNASLMWVWSNGPMRVITLPLERKEKEQQPACRRPDFLTAEKWIERHGRQRRRYGFGVATSSSLLQALERDRAFRGILEIGAAAYNPVRLRSLAPAA